MTPQERKIDITNLKKHREYYALKLELEEFCDKMDSFGDMDFENVSRATMNEEIYGRYWASKNVRELLSSLGLIESKSRSIDKTME